MREIKFRAWSKKLNDYVKPAYFMIDGYGEVFRSEWLDSDTKPKDLIIEQYTGLQDKNGKEIYEGTLLKYGDIWCENTSDDFEPHEEVYIGQVKYDDRNGLYYVENNDGSNTMLAEALSSHYCYVAGNIHENPELLEVSE